MPSEPSPIKIIFRENCLEHHFSSLNPRLLQNGKNIRKTFFSFRSKLFLKGNNMKFIAFDSEILFGRSSRLGATCCSESFSRESSEPFLPRCWCHSSKLFYDFLLFCLCSVAIKMLRGLAQLPLALHSPKASRQKRKNVLISFLSSCWLGTNFDGLSHAGCETAPNTRSR